MYLAAGVSILVQGFWLRMAATIRRSLETRDYDPYQGDTDEQPAES